MALSISALSFCQHSLADEGVEQIVNANLVIGPASNNACVPTYLLKCPMNLPLEGARSRRRRKLHAGTTQG